MEEWKSYKLDDFIEFNPTISLKKGTMARKITMDQLTPHSRDIYSWGYEPYSGGAKFQNGDTIMARITPCLENGKHAFISLLDEGETAYGSTEYIVMRGKPGISDNRFVYYLSHYPDFKNAAIKSMVGSSGRQRAQVDVLKNLEFSLPGLEEQKQIADTLSALDDIIALNNRINHNLEEQAQALYKSWFVDFEPFKGGKFVDSELGMIPKGWRVLPFLSVARLCSGGTPKTDQKEFWNGSIPFFTPKDVGDSAFCLSTEKTITEEGLKNCNSSLYKAFTTFITARGTVGKLCMAGVPMAMNQTNYAICPASNIDVITLFLITKQLINSLRNKANGAVFDAITTRDFDGEKVTIAPQGVMDTFSSVVHPIYESILQNEMKNASLSQLRDSLLPKLMSGDFITSDIPC